MHCSCGKSPCAMNRRIRLDILVHADDDAVRLLPCDACDCQHHPYCLDPPLEEPPAQTVRRISTAGCSFCVSRQLLQFERSAQ
jgi:hypothetical protein